MKIAKNKVVFITVIIGVVLFMIVYAMLALGGEKDPKIEHNKIPIPKLGEQQKEYKSKLDALDDLKEVRQTNAPSIYDEHLLDSTGVYDPDLLEKKKRRIVDSIYNQGRINYTDRSYRTPRKKLTQSKREKDTLVVNVTEKKQNDNSTIELSLEHQLFFASQPLRNNNQVTKNSDMVLYAWVDGTQTVKKDYRLKMRLGKDAYINGVLIPKNTAIYGFVSFQPNRTLVAISHIEQHPVELRAYDLQDGSEGIYIENSFTAQARQELVGDIVDDINIAGVPQVNGIKKILQRSNRHVKVTVYNQYQLILKRKQ